MSNLWTVFFLSLVLSAYPVLSGWGAERLEFQPQVHPMAKITFNLTQLNKDGLYGPPDGLRAMHYEFCIPGDPAYEAQVRNIDPTIEVTKKSRGRIGCSEENSSV
jgi:hypothetical protein